MFRFDIHSRFARLNIASRPVVVNSIRKVMTECIALKMEFAFLYNLDINRRMLSRGGDSSLDLDRL